MSKPHVQAINKSCSKCHFENVERQHSEAQQLIFGDLWLPDPDPDLGFACNACSYSAFLLLLKIRVRCCSLAKELHICRCPCGRQYLKTLNFDI